MVEQKCPDCNRVMTLETIPCPDGVHPLKWSGGGMLFMACAVAHFKHVCKECLGTIKPGLPELTQAEKLLNDWRNFDMQ